MSSEDHCGSTSYDIIFVGGTALSSISALVLRIGSGGTAACVTAGRLSEADPSLKILVSLKTVWCMNIFLIPNHSGRGNWSTYS